MVVASLTIQIRAWCSSVDVAVKTAADSITHNTDPSQTTIGTVPDIAHPTPDNNTPPIPYPTATDTPNLASVQRRIKRLRLHLVRDPLPQHVKSYYHHPHDCPPSTNSVAYHSTHDLPTNKTNDDASVISHHSTHSTHPHAPNHPPTPPPTNNSQILAAFPNTNIDPNVLAILQSNSKLLQHLTKSQTNSHSENEKACKRKPNTNSTLPKLTNATSTVSTFPLWHKEVLSILATQ